MARLNTERTRHLGLLRESRLDQHHHRVSFIAAKLILEQFLGAGYQVV